MTLDELVRDLAERGELTHLSLIPHGTGWSASYSAASPAGGFGQAQADDPVAALFGAIASVKPRKWRKKPHIEITAAVNDAASERDPPPHKAKTNPETAEDCLPTVAPRAPL